MSAVLKNINMNQKENMNMTGNINDSALTGLLAEAAAERREGWQRELDAENERRPGGHVPAEEARAWIESEEGQAVIAGGRRRIHRHVAEEHVIDTTVSSAQVTTINGKPIEGDK